MLIGEHGDVCHVHVDLELFLLDLHHELIEHVLDRLFDGERFRLELEGAGLVLGELEHVDDEPVHPAHFPVDGFKIVIGAVLGKAVL